MFYYELEALAEKMCNDYCKYPHLYDEDNEEQPLSESEICGNCPMTKALEVARNDTTHRKFQ